MQEENPDLFFKIAVMGDASVGKTALIKRIVHDKFSGLYNQTIGVDFALKVHNLVERVVRFQFWDIAGAERFGSQIPRYLNEHTAAVILVWDATRPATFDALPKYFPFIKKGLPIIFVRSKADEDNKDQQDDFEARKKAIAEWTAERGMAAEDVAIVDTSSKDSLGKPELEKAMLDFVPRLMMTPEERKSVSEVPSKVQNAKSPAGVAQSPASFFLTERLGKIKHTRKAREAELDVCLANENPSEDDIIWLSMHLDSVEENCRTADRIRTYFVEQNIVAATVARSKVGLVPELLKLLDEEERRFAPKIITLLFFASYSDRKVAERDIERKFILDVAKNIHLEKEPFEGLEQSKAPKSVQDILVKHANRNIPERK